MEKSEKKEMGVLSIIRPLIAKKRFIVKIILSFFVLGLFLALNSENEFEANTLFIPQRSDAGVGSNISGNLGGLASLAGIEIGSGQSLDFPPELYHTLLENVSFQLKLLDAPLVIKGQSDTVTYRSYYLDIYKPSVVSLISKYTFGLPSLVKNLIMTNDQMPFDNFSIGFLEVSESDKELIERMLKQITIEANMKEGYVSMSFTMPDKYLAAQMASHLENLIHIELIDYQTEKVLMELRNMQARYDERKSEFESIQNSLAIFKDRNQSLNTQASQSELSRLEAEYDLSFSIYSDLARQLEEVELRVLRDTPLIRVIKPIVIPFKKSGPPRVLIVLIFPFLGAGLAIGSIFFVIWLSSLRGEFD
jgi:uncharacterized protein involved in exopolysaccharide biosynthesis